MLRVSPRQIKSKSARPVPCMSRWIRISILIGSTRSAWALAIALLHNWPLEGTVDPPSEPPLAASGRGRERGRERRRGRG